ncbi:RagB/SusD family nutrient uptake outer membrane protein [Flavobacterium marginilacus]|uniref:RagB/SusD family nutrient uptake outer membrane protein n=1 Tax=Flavobacterium marginilacus TaxID=3003256 RepID=UPI00248DCF43|nr:RagB/SusD family nutrient uptake outer membrane protein [Flavobacterium marginilacus]
MKHTIIIAGIVLASLFTSCQEDYLDTPAQSSLDESVIFSSVTLASGAIDGIKIPFAETNSYRGRFLPYYGLNSDLEWNNASTSAGDTAELQNYGVIPTNTIMNTTNNAWQQMYAGIERANICIRGLRLYGNPKPGTDLGYLLGEAITLRAIYYADLVKAWGDVPYRFEPVTNATIYQAKVSRDIIYKQLLTDLAEAATLVPWPNETTATNSVERINKAFVKALRARIAMAAGGFQQYPDGIRKSNDPALSTANMYSLALTECREVIASGKAHLEPSFETFWRNYNKEVITAGGESLWELPFADGRGRMLYSFAVKHTSSDQFTAQPRGGSAGPLPFVFYDYNQKDTRRDVTCVPYKYGTAVNGVAKQELGSLNTWYFGKYRYEWMTRKVVSDNDDGVNKVYMRYAEVLLLAAEAANELEGVAAAKPYLKEIRNRAFAAADRPLNVDAYLAAINSKDDMFNALVKENEYEFTGEMERKQALIRWNLLAKNLDLAKTKMKALQTRTGDYANVPSTLFYKYDPTPDAKGNPLTTLIIYGLNRGETTSPGADYTAWTWVALDDAKIASLYKTGVNPDNRQFWPIWQVFLDSSNGLLKNDYNY